MSLKDILKNKLSEEELKLVPRSFDIIGSREKAVAIIEIPDQLKNKEKIIAEGIMKLHKNVKSVLKKVSGRKGIERLREYELIAGDENTEVIHKEYGYILKLDPRKVYFSPREATERQRIASKVKDGEKVLVMFCGIAPYCIAIAKKANVEKVYGIEINEAAHLYAKHNVRVNGLSHKVVLINGDVREVCPKLKEKFDRIVMPLPLGSETFLDLALKCVKRNGIIHFYSWGKEDNLFENGIKAIEKNVKKFKKRYEILEKRKVLPYAPKRWKVCIDFKVF
ncbi:MAG: class I SAM-dependent methyltransferase family protein [Candidatus Aenigmatarchaeota archaeon]|nr:MAG: class I SAM-dependent methyltransferase family protein [Candidatus Aenigmarchaeota archaeon]